MKKILLWSLGIQLVAFSKADKMTGLWTSKPSSGGNTTAAIFRENSSFEAYINNNLFVSGTYSFSETDSVFTITDNGCNGLTGEYKILFFSNSDSLRFAVLRDNCIERKEQVEGLIMGRVK